jgi:hypothetical protein
VPLTGTVYRIKTAGAPSECTKPRGKSMNGSGAQDHVEFTFVPSTAQLPTGPMGPAGPMGPQGPQGEVGPMGPAGPQGEVGPAGAQGDAGPAGPQGIKGETGSMGPQGPMGMTGATGAQGPQGNPGVSAYEVINRTITIATGATQAWTTNCSVGKKVFGGGYFANDGNGANVQVSKNAPFSGNGSWVVEFKNSSGSSSSFTLYAICGNVNP